MKTILGMFLMSIAAFADCRTEGSTTVCSKVYPNRIVFTIHADENQNQYLPITGWWVDGRLKLADGNLQAFAVSVNRDWDGDTKVIIKAISGVIISGVSHLTLIPRRDDVSIIFYNEN